MDESVLKKLKKILALANDPAAGEGEAFAAMAKAKKLAMLHQIELSSVDFRADTKTVNGFDITSNNELKTSSKYRQPHHKYVFWILQDLFDVHVILNTYPEDAGTRITCITLVGDATDIAICKELFP